MRLATFRDQAGVHCGVVRGDQVVPVGAFLDDHDAEHFVDLDALLAEEGALEHLRASMTDTPAGGVWQLLDEVELLPPVRSPSKILVVGANSWSHLEEAGLFTMNAAPERPMLLSKPPTAVNGPFGEILHLAETTQLDYEVELAVVIGRVARNVPEDDVKNYLAGYTVANDVSERDLQLSSWEANDFFRTHFLGKAIDGYCPLGPWLVTPDEFAAAGHERLRTFVNDELRQDGHLGDLIFSVPQLVSYISRYVTLLPGDVILTGSPAGVGYFFGPSGFLQPGDVVRCEIEGIGALENTVVAHEEGSR